MSLLNRIFASPPPEAAIEIAADAVSGAVIGTRSGRPLVQACAMQAFPAGTVAPSLTGRNIGDRQTVVTALQAVISRLGGRPTRVALIVPDVVTRVSLVKFDQIPGRREDLDQLMRWQLKKSAPFPLEEASLTYVVGAASPEGGREYLVALARREAIREYESVCEEAGLHPGLVDLSTFGVVNSVLATGSVPPGDWLLVHRRVDYTSIVIMRDRHIIFFRNRPEGDGDPLAELVHQTAMYYQDRLAGQGFSHILFSGGGETGVGDDDTRSNLELRLRARVDTVDPTRVAALADQVTATSALAARLAPLVGTLLRSRQNAVAA